MRTTFFFLASMSLLLMTFGCNIDRTENVNIKSENFFAFDPTSILSSIEKGAKDTFSPIDEEPGLQSTSQSQPVTWKQADYFRLAEALNEKVGGESFENWNLKEMYFSLGCNQVELGFQYGQFKFFQIRNANNEEIRVERFIEIDPTRNFARAMEVEYSPNLENWKAIDLQTIRVSAEEALSIAEKNGGYEKRTAVENKCGISVGTSQDINTDWLTIYSPSLFVDRINLVTGK